MGIKVNLINRIKEKHYLFHTLSIKKDNAIEKMFSFSILFSTAFQNY